MKQETKFYEFNQNNSGGFFDVDENVCNYVIIEASSADEAIRKLRPMIANQSESCPCCGERWSLDYYDVIDFSDKFESIEDYMQHIADEQWGVWTEPLARIFYKDGSKKEIYSSRQMLINNHTPSE